MAQRNNFEMFLKTIGLNVKKVRYQTGMTQSELAKMAGIATISLGKIERGEYGTKLQTLFDIASVLKVSPAQLLSDDHTLILSKEKLSVLLQNEGDI